MGLKINYWSCKFQDYEELWDGENVFRLYNCTNKKGCGTCDLNNKWNDDQEHCDIAEIE